MRRPRNLLELHNVAQAYGQRPSTVLGIEGDGWLAYQVDVACLVVARTVEERTAPDEQGRPRMSVEEALGEPQHRTTGRFADPTPFVSGVMEIPESGVW